MRILLTGGSGQVGREVLRRAGRRAVLAPDRQAFDLSRPDSLRPWLERERPGLILSVGAYTAVDRAEDEAELAFRINRDAVASLASYARNRGALLLHLSTDYVFDGHLDRPYREDDATSPAGVYGHSKLAGELAAREADQHLILRVGWVFGALGNNFVRTMLRLGAERDSLRVVGDQFGGPTWAGHIAEALLTLSDRVAAGRKLPVGLWHFGGQPHLSWHAFAETIFAEAQRLDLMPCYPRISPIPSTDYPTRAQRPANSCLDSRLATAELGLAAPDWRQGLDSVLQEWARTRQSN